MAITADVRVMPDTFIEKYDFEGSSREYRCVGLRIDGLSLALGLTGGDEETVICIDAVASALADLRQAARYRMEQADLAKRDDLIDAGIGTGYVGEFR